MSSKIGILDLPEEVLYKICLYLDFYDKKPSAMVCKKFLQVLNRPALMKNITVRVHGSELPEDMLDNRWTVGNTVDLFARTQRPYQSIYIGFVSVDTGNPRQILNAISLSLTTLTLSWVKISDRTFANLLRRSTNLENVTLTAVVTFEWEADTFADISCRNIRRFKWQSRMDTNILMALTSAMPHLEGLEIDGDWGSRWAYHTNSILNALTKTMIATEFKRILVSKAETLKFISFRKTPIAGILLKMRKAPPQLETLELEEVEIDERRLNRFIRLQTQLKNVTLIHCDFGNTTLEIIGQFALESLHLAHPNNDVDDAGLAALNSLKSLTKLNITNMALTDQGFNLGIMQLNFQNLSSLVLTKLIHISALVFERFINGACNLKILSIYSNPKLMTNTNLQLIFQKLLNLRELYIGGSVKITDAGFLGNDKSKPVFEIKRLKLLKELRLENLDMLTDKGTRAIANDSLKKLFVHNCSRISLNGIKKMIQQCPLVEELSINGMPHVDQDALQAFCKINLKRFNVLSYSRCDDE